MTSPRLYAPSDIRRVKANHSRSGCSTPKNMALSGWNPPNKKFRAKGAVCSVTAVKHTITQPIHADMMMLPGRSTTCKKRTLTRDSRSVSSRPTSSDTPKRLHKDK